MCAVLLPPGVNPIAFKNTNNNNNNNNTNLVNASNKFKVTSVFLHAMKAYKGSRCIAPLILHHGTGE
jgi:copper(I)-binding protein